MKLYKYLLFTLCLGALNSCKSVGRVFLSYRDVHIPVLAVTSYLLALSAVVDSDSLVDLAELFAVDGVCESKPGICFIKGQSSFVFRHKFFSAMLALTMLSAGGSLSVMVNLFPPTVEDTTLLKLS